MIKQALISVSDKSAVVEFAHKLCALGITILSTGGTATLLRQANIPLTEVAQVTGFPEILNGRVKTLHPKIHGAILARRSLTEDLATLRAHAITPIDLLVVNLYPFKQTIANADCSLEDAVENIDIGGPAMLRSAAKNYRDVTVVVDAADYEVVLNEIQENHHTVSMQTNLRLAIKAFAHTAHYDAAITDYLTRVETTQIHQHGVSTPSCYPATLNLTFEKAQDLRYGENPHQHAAFYRDIHLPPGAFAHYRQLQGQQLSYNNIADADTAWACVKTFDRPACVIVKHNNPCGAALGANSADAYTRALQTDPTSAFGGIIAFNNDVDDAAAHQLIKLFVEVLIAPAFTEGAKQVLATKQNIRLLEIPPVPSLNTLPNTSPNTFDLKRISGGLLVQSADIRNVQTHELRVVTKRYPTPKEMEDLLFAWRIAKFVKSNAIVFCAHAMTLGIGAGQTSRVDAARFAGIKAQRAGLSLAGSAAASDAFFPFRDGLDTIVASGATCVIQPGGSIRDDEVVAAADEHCIAMVLTGTRHFRH